jgi:hypothetical protein
MKKSNIDDRRLYTPAFTQVCIAVFLLYAATYLHLPVTEHAATPLFFMAGMLAIGPFHAYLEDAYKRKHIFVYSAFLLALLLAATPVVKPYIGKVWWASVMVQGGLFSLAVTAGNTVSIDITHSLRRTRANIIYAFFSRMGMLTGLTVGFACAYRDDLIYWAAAATLLSLFFVLWIHVPFRSPIELSFCSLDRFLLPLGWLPALNVFLGAFALGCFPPALPLLLLLIVPMTHLFVNLSFHCQRGTANGMLQTALDLGVLAGLGAGSYYHPIRGYLALSVAAAALLLFFLVAYPYYRRKRVR